MKEIKLVPYDHKLHLDSLYHMMMDPEEQALFMMSGRCNSLKEFDRWIQERLDFTYKEFFVLHTPETDQSFGFIYATDMRIADGHCKIGVYVSPAVRSLGLGASSVIAFLQYLFRLYPLRKVYSEVYAYNRESIQNHIDAGFTKECIYKEYRYYDGKYHDLHVFSIDRKNFEDTYFSFFSKS